MRIARPLTALAVVAVVLSGCATSTVVAGSEVAVAVADPFTSLNPTTSYARAGSTNGDVAHLTGTGFAYVDAALGIVEDDSFGTAVIVAEDPLTVRYSVSSDARWSDGVPVDAADLLLAWAANSGALNTPDFDDADYVDPETGRYTDEFPDDVVYFDGRIGAGLELASQTPQLADDGRTLFVHFDAYLPDWRTVLAPGIPAHVLAARALDLDPEATPEEAKAALVAAIVGPPPEGDALAGGPGATPDPRLLAPLARMWNDAYNLDATPEDPALLVASGPYTVSEIAPDGVVLVANPEYRGMRQPVYETIRIRVSPDPLETVGLLADGEVDIIAPEPTVDVVTALATVDGITVTTGSDSRVEHIDLQFADSRSGAFDDPLVRRAFLLTVPRDAIVAELLGPVQPDAEPLDSFVLRPAAAGYADAVATNGSAEYATPDIDAARELLAEAGADSPRVCVLFDADNPRRRAEFELIRDSAELAGFRVSDCSNPDWRGLLGVAGAYDAALFAWDTTRLGPTAVSAVFRSDSALANFSRYDNPEVDALVAELESPAAVGRETEILTRIDELLWADAYGLPLFAYPTLTAVSDDVAGVVRSPLARGVFGNAWEWHPAAVED